MRARCLLRRFVLPAALACLVASGTGPSRADIQNPGRSSFPGDRRLARQAPAPPNAVPQTASVVEGGSVTIILRARGHSGEMVDFVLRTPPAHGSLDSDPRQLTLNSAEVTYTHHPGDNVGADSFTYAVQTRDSALSAEAAVTVRIQEPPPVLAMSPAELDFGAVKAGETTRAELTITNQGGGEAAGRLEPPPPWVVEGNADYRLPRGGSQTFALVFKPTGERAYADALHLRYEASGGVRLVGTGLAGPGQGLAVADRSKAGANPSLVPAVAGPGGNAPSQTLAAGATGANLAPVAAAASANPTPARPVVTSLEPDVTGGTGGTASLPPAMVVAPGDPEVPAVNSVAVRDRGRSTLDLSWRVPMPSPKSYRVEIRYLSLGADDRLIVEWRPYALTEFQTTHGFVNAHLSGLSANTQECIRVVAVDDTGRLAVPSPMVVVYTLPPATWWRPTPLKVLFALLLVCGGLVARQRWETRQILREIDESRRRAHAMQR